jgi:hypothetical protein
MSFKMHIWDYFSHFLPEVTKLQMKLTSKDPYFYMPSISDIVLSINIPPSNCIISVQPTSGNAITQ